MNVKLNYLYTVLNAPTKFYLLAIGFQEFKKFNLKKQSPFLRKFNIIMPLLDHNLCPKSMINDIIVSTLNKTLCGHGLF